MSVSKAVAKVGAEIMNTRVEMPAMATPMTELTRVSLRRRAVARSGSCKFRFVSLSHRHRRWRDHEWTRANNWKAELRAGTRDGVAEEVT
jgi:hypothetical protein